MNVFEKSLGDKSVQEYYMDEFKKEFDDIEQTRLDFRNNYQLWNPDHNISKGLLQSIIDPELMCVDVMKREYIFESSKTTCVVSSDGSIGAFENSSIKSCLIVNS